MYPTNHSFEKLISNSLTLFLVILTLGGIVNAQVFKMNDRKINRKRSCIYQNPQDGAAQIRIK